MRIILIFLAFFSVSAVQAELAPPKVYETTVWIKAAQMDELCQNLSLFQRIGKVTGADQACSPMRPPESRFAIAGKNTIMIFVADPGPATSCGRTTHFIMCEDRVGDLDAWHSILEFRLGSHALTSLLVGVDSDDIPYDRGFFIKSPFRFGDSTYKQTSRIFPLEFEPDYLRLAYPSQSAHWGFRRQDVIAAREQYDATKPVKEFSGIALREPAEQIVRDKQALETFGFRNLGTETTPLVTDGDFTFAFASG